MQPAAGALFSLKVVVRDIGRKGQSMKLEADAGQRAALAKTLAIAAIERLVVEFHLDRVRGGAVHLRGRLVADVVQICVVSLDPVQQHIEEPMRMTLLPAEAADGGPQKRVPIDPMEEEDQGTFCEGRIDLDRIVHEQLALSLDPYPRAPGADLEASGGSEVRERASPFATLERLKRDRG